MRAEAQRDRGVIEIKEKPKGYRGLGSIDQVWIRVAWTTTVRTFDGRQEVRIDGHHRVRSRETALSGEFTARSDM